jgi:ElaB/YqjD/DUF883 family membrane-anchored ribosome-binding protein
VPRTLVNGWLDVLSNSIHTPTTMINATPQQLRKAADIQEKIQSLQMELDELLGSPVEAAATKAPKKRKMSAAGLANIRAGVRKRMLAQGKRAAVQKPKRKVSAAAKARLSRLAKARWAAVKKAGKSRL